MGLLVQLNIIHRGRRVQERLFQCADVCLEGQSVKLLTCS